MTKRVGRFTITRSRDAILDDDYGYGATIEYVDGWNDGCERRRINLSVEELRDLRYAVDRAIAQHEDEKRRHHDR